MECAIFATDEIEHFNFSNVNKMKDSKQIFKRGLLSCMVAALAIGFAVAQENQEETVWTDVTQYFVVNPDYSDGTTGWTITGGDGLKVNHGNAEFFNEKASAMQIISNLPAGNYKLTVQAFFRSWGNNTDNINAHKNGTEVIDAYIVAGEEEIKIKSLFSELDNATVNQSNGYPNGQEGANAYFTTYPNSYMNEVPFTVEVQGDVKIGVDVRAGKGDRWTCWDNFKLYKEGEFDPLALLKVQASNLASLSEELTTLGASAVAAEVNAYITTYNGYTAETPAETISAAVAEATELAASISGNVIPAIESLNAAVAAAESVSGKYATAPEPLKGNLTAAITDAKNVLATTGLATIVAAAGTEVTEVTAASKALTNFIALTLPLNKAKALADRIDVFNANKALADADAYKAVETSLANAALGYDEMAANVAALNAVIKVNMTTEFLNTAEENPIDMTSFIVNPYIYQNGVKTANPGGWTCVRDGHDGNARTTSEYDDSDLYAYLWTGNLLTGSRYHQELSGLPSGIYDLKAVTCCNNGSDRTKLWASLDNETYQEVNFSGDNETTYLTKRDALETNTTIENITVGAEDVLYIGVRVTGVNSGAGKWFRADNFALYYVKADPTAIYKERLAASLETAQPLHDKLVDYGIDDANYLGKALDEEEGYKVLVENGTLETLQEAIDHMDELMANAEQIIANYETVNAIIVKGEALSEKIENGSVSAHADLVSAFNAALATASTNANNKTWDNYLTEQILTDAEALTAASKALTDFVALTLPLKKAKALADRIGGLAETEAYADVVTSLDNATLGYDEMATNVAALNAVIRDNMTAAFLSTATEENPIDMTSFIVNPYIYQSYIDENTGQPSANVLPGWVTDTNADKPERTGANNGNTWMYCTSWSSNNDHNISSATNYHQQVAVPNGYYKLEAATVSSGGSGNLKLYMRQADGTFIQSNFNGNWDNWNAAQDAIDGTTTITPSALIEGGTVVLGIRGEGRIGGNGQYWQADNFTLLYTGPNKNRLIDGVGFHAAEEYTATTMSYDREFTKDTWLTVCLPFAYTLPEGVIAEEIKSVDIENGVFTFVTVEAMEANKPYIIKNTTENAALFAALENVTVAATPAVMETTVEGATMAGVYESVKAADLVENNDVLFFNTEGELKYLDAANTEAVEAITFTPFRAYILVDKNTFDDNTAKAISVRHTSNESTGIEFSTRNPQPATVIYDLMGRRVEKAEKGIYIVNGKKVIR